MDRSYTLEDLKSCLAKLADEGAIPRAAAEHPLTEETSWEDLGLDSMGTLDLVTEIEAQSGLFLTPAELSTLTGVGSLLARINQTNS